MGSVEGDLDVRTEEAWVALTDRLAQVMEALEPKRFLCIEVEAWRGDEPLDGAIRYVQAMRLDDGVHVEASSNYYLATRFRLGKEERATLRALGFRKPGSKRVHNYWATFGVDRLDEAAEVLVGALRDGFGVIHPVFLQSDQPDLAALLSGGAPPEAELAQAPGQARASLWELADGEEMATYPRGTEHLQALVIQALTPMLGAVPEPDDDGEIAVRADTAVAFVGVAPDMPLVTIHAFAVVDVQDEAAAVIEAGLLNRDTPGVQFVADGAVVSARVVLPATPFVPPMLRMTLDRMLNVLPRVDKDLARRVRGRVFLSEPRPADAFDAGKPCVGASDSGGGGLDACEPQASGPNGSAADDLSEWASRRASEVLDQMHPVLGKMVVNDLEEPDSLLAATASRFCGDDPRVMRKVLRSSRIAEAALRDCRRDASSRHDREAGRLFRNLRRSTRRVRAAVKQALQRAEP